MLITRPSWIKYLCTKKYLFVHINKTAGTSIEQHIGQPFSHITASELQAQLGSYLYNRKYSFAVVRNPFDRVSSHYHHRLRMKNQNILKYNLSFCEWVHRAYSERDPRFYDIPLMFKPCFHWLSDGKDNICVKKILRFESISEDFQQLVDSVPAFSNVGRVLPKVKKSANCSLAYRDLYDDNTVQVISDVFSDDIKHFGYSF